MTGITPTTKESPVTEPDPHAARTLPPLPQHDDYVTAMRTLVTAVDGLPPHEGDRLFAVVDTVKMLRANPELARILLDQ